MKMTRRVLITIILSSMLLASFNHFNHFNRSSAQFTCLTSGGGGPGSPAPTPSCYYNYYTRVVIRYNAGIICEDTYAVRERYCFGALVERQDSLRRHYCYEE
jgi:hypothetical protein